MFIIFAIFTAFSTTMLTRSCGEVTMITPSSGQGLEHVQCHVARSRRHVDEHIVDIVPQDVAPRTAARRRR